MENKSILEQALLHVNTIEEAVKHNAKGILAATMKPVLSSLLKEEDEDDENTSGFGDPDEEGKDLPVDTGDAEETSDNDELPADEDPSTEDSDVEPSLEDGEDLDSLDGDEDFDDLEGGEDEDETLDMTGASAEEVAKVFRAMKPEDGIIVKKEGDNLELSVDEPGEYIIKLDEQVEENNIADENIYEIELDDEECDECDKTMTGEFDEDKNDPYSQSKGEVVKSPTLPLTKDSNVQKGGGSKHQPFTNAKGEVVKSPTLPLTKPENKQGGTGTGTKPFTNSKGDVVKNPVTTLVTKTGTQKGEQTEAARTKTNPHGSKNEDQNRTGIGGKRIYKAGSSSFGTRANTKESINEELEILRKQNSEYKKALVLFKDKLNEVAVFNANLAYATRLFTEHTTTKQEKLDILKRFDSVSTITESKTLYGQIKNELGDKKPITEQVADKIASPAKSSSSTEMLSEAKAYENPQFTRMKALMGIKK